MKTSRSIHWPQPTPKVSQVSALPEPEMWAFQGTVAAARRGERGVSLLIILALLASMAIIVAANSTAIALLKQELKLIDQRQMKKYGQGQGH